MLVPFLVAVITWLTESNLKRVGLCWLTVQSNTVHHCGAPLRKPRQGTCLISAGFLPYPLSSPLHSERCSSDPSGDLFLSHTKVCLLNSLGEAGEMAQFMLQGPEFDPEKLLQKSQALWHAPNASKEK